MQMSNLTTQQVEEYLKTKTSIVIPAGSIEQHGDMAPMGCDTIIPVRLCYDAAKKSGTLVAPALSYGLSSSHMDFTGTMSVRGSTLSAMVVDIVKSLYHHGFRKILFLSGHGGNKGPIMTGLADAGADCPLTFMRYLGYWELPGAAEKEIELFGEDVGWHITASEVSMVWYLLRRKMPEPLTEKYPPAPAPGSVLSSYLWKQYYPKGGEGSDLSRASVEKGKELYEYLVSVLEDQFSRMDNDSI